MGRKKLGVKLAERDTQELLDVDDLMALLGLDNINYTEVRDDAVPGEYVELWESRGYEVGKVGIVIVVFDGSSKRYTYPLHLSKK